MTFSFPWQSHTWTLLSGFRAMPDPILTFSVPNHAHNEPKLSEFISLPVTNAIHFSSISEPHLTRFSTLSWLVILISMLYMYIICSISILCLYQNVLISLQNVDVIVWYLSHTLTHSSYFNARPVRKVDHSNESEAHPSHIWITIIYPSTELMSFQHELGLAADEGVRQLLEHTDGEVGAVEKSAAMKVAASKRAEALHKKMSKLVCVANPELTDGWLREVCPLLYSTFFILQFISWPHWFQYFILLFTNCASLYS